jgi:hypothetical protein
VAFAEESIASPHLKITHNCLVAMFIFRVISECATFFQFQAVAEKTPKAFRILLFYAAPMQIAASQD